MTSTPSHGVTLRQAHGVAIASAHRPSVGRCDGGSLPLGAGHSIVRCDHRTFTASHGVPRTPGVGVKVAGC